MIFPFEFPFSLGRVTGRTTYALAALDQNYIGVGGWGNFPLWSCLHKSIGLVI